MCLIVNFQNCISIPLKNFLNYISVVLNLLAQNCQWPRYPSDYKTLWADLSFKVTTPQTELEKNASLSLILNWDQSVFLIFLPIFNLQNGFLFLGWNVQISVPSLCGERGCSLWYWGLYLHNWGPFVTTLALYEFHQETKKWGRWKYLLDFFATVWNMLQVSKSIKYLFWIFFQHKFIWTFDFQSNDSFTQVELTHSLF